MAECPRLHHVKDVVVRTKMQSSVSIGVYVLAQIIENKTDL